MKPSFILFSFLLLAGLSSCGYFNSSTPEDQSYEYMPLYDTTANNNATGEYNGDTSVPYESKVDKYLDPSPPPGVTPVFENNKRIGRIVNGQFIPRKGVQPVQPPGYYETEYARKKDSLNAK